MKNIIILLLLLSYGCFQAQNTVDSTFDKTSLARMYILDTIYEPGQTRKIQTDFNRVNCLYIQDGHVWFMSTIRGKVYRHYGEIDGYSQKDNYESFFTRGRKRSANEVYSWEILPFNEGTGEIHFYKKTSSFDYFFKAHLASESEMEYILSQDITAIE